MGERTLLHSSEMELNGEVFEIEVFSSAAGRYFAQTRLGAEDYIITDGFSAPEALKKHEELLPLAVGSREITQSYMGIRRGRARRM